MTNVSIHSSIH